MLHNLAQLPRYRGLIQSMVARELKARYRGSVLGFFWSFINPLLFLLVYSFVFTFVMPASQDPRVTPFADRILHMEDGALTREGDGTLMNPPARGLNSQPPRAGEVVHPC